MSVPPSLFFAAIICATKSQTRGHSGPAEIIKAATCMSHYINDKTADLIIDSDNAMKALLSKVMKLAGSDKQNSTSLLMI